MAIKRTRAALYVVCITRAGYVNGARLIEFIEDWGRVVREHGGPITIDQYDRFGRLPRRTAFRRLKLFRETFPQLGPAGLPSDLMAPLLAQLAAEAESES